LKICPGTLQYYLGAPCIHGIEIGYVIHNPSDRGKGYATEAVRLFSDFLFDSRPLDFRQHFIIEVWNAASWKVAERAGFLREGVLRSSGFGTGDPADSFIYSRTREADDCRGTEGGVARRTTFRFAHPDFVACWNAPPRTEW